MDRKVAALIGLGIAAVVGYLIYRHVAEEAKKEEERVRRMAEAFRLTPEQIRVLESMKLGIQIPPPQASMLTPEQIAYYRAAAEEERKKEELIKSVSPRPAPPIEIPKQLVSIGLVAPFLIRR